MVPHRLHVAPAFAAPIGGAWVLHRIVREHLRVRRHPQHPQEDRPRHPGRLRSREGQDRARQRRNLIGEVLDELAAFPEGSHDDQIDALSDGFECLLRNRTEFLVFTFGCCSHERRTISVSSG